MLETESNEYLQKLNKNDFTVSSALGKHSTIPPESNFTATTARASKIRMVR